MACYWVNFTFMYINDDDDDDDDNNNSNNNKARESKDYGGILPSLDRNK